MYKKKLKIQPDKVRLLTDNELNGLPATYMDIPTLNWQEEALSDAAESDSEEEVEFEATGKWRTVPYWRDPEDEWSILTDWKENPLPTEELDPDVRVLISVDKVPSCTSRVEFFIGKSFQTNVGGVGKDQEGMEDFKLPIYRPWWDHDPMPGVPIPRFIWQVESLTDLTTDRKIKVVKFNDNSVFQTEFRVLRRNNTEYIDVEEVEELPEEIEELLSLDVLETIRPLFNHGPLSMEEYKNAIADALGLSDDPAAFPKCLSDLFTKIDTFAVDKIAWDDLCDFLQQQYAEKAETEYSSPPVAVFPPCIIFETPHRSPITRAFTLADKGLLCFSEDGIVSLWTSSFKPRIWRALGRAGGQKTLSNISDKKSSKWFTDMVHLPRIAKFIVPTGERELQFYDTATYDPYCQIIQLYSVPIHIDAKLTHNMSLIIVMGDMQGCVTVLMIEFCLQVKRFQYFGIGRSNGVSIATIPTIAIHDAVGTQQGVKYAKFKVHDDMVSCIHYCTSLNRVVTASISQTRSLVMGTLLTTWTANEMMESMTTNFVEGVSDLALKPKRRKPADELIFPISQGCRTFDIWEEKKWLAAGGLDRLVWVWNMYVPSQPVAKLRGHNAALFKVIFDPRSGTLFSICTEKTIRIWQLLTNTCIHTLDVKGSKIKGQILHCFSPTTDGILIQTNDDCQYLRITRSGDESQEEGTSHADGITAICYNPQHEFIMSCSSEDILVWECETGKCVAEFNTIGGDGSMHLDTIAEKKDAPMEEENIFIMPLPILHGREQVDTYEVGTVTCVTLDNMGRRFFTAHANGVIKAWNFYNGRNLYNLYKPLDNNDICDMHYITVNAEHRYLMTVGWDRRVVIYIDTQGPEVVHQLSLPDEPIEFTHDSLGHRDDIWACTFGYPNLIASGDYSGRLLVWNINSGHIVGYLKTNGARDRAYAKDKFITSLVFHTQTVKGKKTTYLISSGPYHLMHMWRANTTRELNVGSVGWTRPCDLPRDYVTCIKTVPENNLIVCADTWGCVSVWTIEDHLGEKEPTEWFPKQALKHGKDSSGFKPVGTYEVTRTKRRAKGTRSELTSATTVNSTENLALTTTEMSSAAVREFIDTSNPVYSFNISKLASKFGILLKNEEEDNLKKETRSKEGASSSIMLKKKQVSTQTITLDLNASGDVEIAASVTQSRRFRETEKEKNRMTEFAAQRDNPETLSVRSLRRKKGFGLGPVRMKFLRSWKCHVDGFATLEVCNTYGLIVTGSKDRSVRVWDFEGQYIGVLGQPDQWLIGDPTTYAPMFPQDVILDVKRIRALEFFRKPPPPPLEAEVKAEELVRAMLQQAEQRRMTDLDITGKSLPYEKLLFYDVPTVLWIQPDAPVGSYRKSIVDKQQEDIPYHEGAVPKRRGHRLGSQDISHIQMLCLLLQVLLAEHNVTAETSKEDYEMFFVFCCIWAFGSPLLQGGSQDHRTEFSKWWQSEWKQVQFPPSPPSIFDFYIDKESRKLLPWSTIVPKFELDPDVPLQATLVHTPETIRLSYFMDLFVEQRQPLMLVGSAGSGKTVLIRDKLSGLSENYTVATMPLNFYTTSEMLQGALEKPLEKKAGRNFGPPGNKNLVYFIDDFNMPVVDEYGTVQPHTLVRQHLDYGHWYDRTKIQLKDIFNVQYISSMNPTAGCFTINPRLQRHFAVFSVSFPANDSLESIYTTILQQHIVAQIPAHAALTKTSESIVAAALALHSRVTHAFLPTAVKFHYVFNLRDLSNVFQGLLFSNAECLKTTYDLLRLWYHESTRVYGDKLVDEKDILNFQKFIYDCFKKFFEDLDESQVMAKPLIYFHFALGAGDPKYMPVLDYASLQTFLQDSLKSYNDFNSIMNLVLFEAATNYVCRISRILESPRGNALLVGVGGSGKQSLARLASFLSGLDVFQLTLRKGYGIQDLKSDLAALYLRAGQKNLGTVFLMTDAQVAEEEFLVLINYMLASGEIPDLLPDDEVENVVAAVRSEVKAVGLPDTRENCWKFFIERVKKVLKVVLCFSPVGSTLRNRARKFPTITSSTSIVWFHEWPQEALISVSYRFVADIDTLPEKLHMPISTFMAYVHMSVSEMSKVYLANDKRYNYTTPKSFLEQIDLYRKLVTEKISEVITKADRLEAGLKKLDSCALQVEQLKETLAVQEVVLKEKNDKADELIKIVGEESEAVRVEKENAAKEEANVAVVAEEVAKIQEVCQIELEKAEPALQAAYAALNTLNKTNLTELKTFTTPPPDVVLVVAAVFILWEGTRTGKLPKDKSWKASKSQMMGDIGKFLDGLQNLNKEGITTMIVDAIKPYIMDPCFQPEIIRAKSFAASGLCSYVINVLKFNEVWQDVAPKRKALQDANDELTANLDKLAFLKARIQELEDKLSNLTREFEAATEAKMKCQAEADKTGVTIDLANRLVGGLASEKIRWINSVKNYRESTVTIPGDILLITAFISYVGGFTKKYRLDLLEKDWIPFLEKFNPPIPTSVGLDPLNVLTDDAQVAEWTSYGLPSNRMSIENAIILMNSQRWPLMIDPQLQGLKWIKNMYGTSLQVVRLGQKGYLEVIEDAITKGEIVLIENIQETLEPALDSLLARNFIKKGSGIKIGDKEVDYNPKFRLILQSKLANPHYQPEMQAQTTLINFTVTIDGLEDQLLAEVVKVERPDLESLKSQLTQQQNEFKILLRKLENDLLTRLQTAEGSFLDDDTLVVNLETTKRMAVEVETKAKEAIITSANIDAARELYRPAASRASLLYFILNDLHKINPIYQFSLKAFSTVFQNAIRLATPAQDVSSRVSNLIDRITYSVWLYTTRGLFENDKLIFTAQLVFQIQLTQDAIQPRDFDFLLRYPVIPNVQSPVDYLGNNCWGAIKSLSLMENFRGIDKDIEGSPGRWKVVLDADNPERKPFPGDWRSKSGVQRLCIMRCLRPDRMVYALSVFIEETLGSKYVKSVRVDFSESFKETSNETPVFFILSPGVDPLSDVEALGRKLAYSLTEGNFHNVSLGQGQEVIAEKTLELAAQKGHWVILQNIHLVARWLPQLEKKLEQFSQGSHSNYRVFLSAEPAASSASHLIPQGILESSIKITNEAPTGMLANIHKAMDNFSQETIEMCSKELEFKAILFTLCYFHAVVAERRKFGTQGWNRSYPFNTGDLTISVNVLHNYLEANTQVPWEDLRYLFGEIMYGGHITDDWDRRLCRSYLEEFLVQECLDGEIEYAPGFPAPPSTDYGGYHQYIDQVLPPESPMLYGLHPNAEIGFLTATSDNLFKIIFELQPRNTAGAGGGGSGGEQSSGGGTKEEKVKSVLDDIIERLPDPFNVGEIQGRAEERTPFVVVALQECERMNLLTILIRDSLKELDAGLKGELTVTGEMEELGNSMFMDKVPAAWTKISYPSTLGLGSWYADLLLRVRELEIWCADFLLPPSVWLSGFFNPQSFLTAIMQSTARKQELPLDNMCLLSEVTKKTRDEMTNSPKDGAYIHGLFMEGARWDPLGGCVAESRLKELFAAMPVIFMRAVTQDKQDSRSAYECPLYRTRQRGPHYVWTFNLRTKERSSKWVLGGVAILLQV